MCPECEVLQMSDQVAIITASVRQRTLERRNHPFSVQYSVGWTGNRRSSHHTLRARPRKSERVRQEDQTLKGSSGLANSEQSAQKASLGTARCLNSSKRSSKPLSQHEQLLQGSKSLQKNGAKTSASSPSSPSTAQEFAASNGVSQKPDNPGDYWTPQGKDQGGEWHEQLGALSPFPDHDGTECLKWDDSLWSHADHFKVRHGILQLCDCTIIDCIPS